MVSLQVNPFDDKQGSGAKATRKSHSRPWESTVHRGGAGKFEYATDVVLIAQSCPLQLGGIFPQIDASKIRFPFVIFFASLDLLMN